LIIVVVFPAAVFEIGVLVEIVVVVVVADGGFAVTLFSLTFPQLNKFKLVKTVAPLNSPFSF